MCGIHLHETSSTQEHREQPMRTNDDVPGLEIPSSPGHESRTSQEMEGGGKGAGFFDPRVPRRRFTTRQDAVLPERHKP
jgi:hypothetical protein